MNVKHAIAVIVTVALVMSPAILAIDSQDHTYEQYSDEAVSPYSANPMEGDVYVSAGGSDSGAGTENNPFGTITKAYSEIVGGRTIWLLTDLALPSAITLSGKAVTIASLDTTPKKISRGAVDSADLITIGAGADVTLENIIVDGSGVAGKNSLLVTSGGKLTLSNGATVQNGGGGVWLGNSESDTGTLILEDGSEIKNHTGYWHSTRHNESTTAGGVGVLGNTTFTMEGGDNSEQQIRICRRDQLRKEHWFGDDLGWPGIWQCC